MYNQKTCSKGCDFLGITGSGITSYCKYAAVVNLLRYIHISTYSKLGKTTLITDNMSAFYCQFDLTLIT